MNNDRRKRIAKAVGLLQEAREILDAAKDEEEQYHDDMPEGFQQGVKGEKAQAAFDNLDECITHLDDAISAAENAAE